MKHKPKQRKSKAPGGFEWAGLILANLFKKFPNDRAAEKWIESFHRQNGLAFPHFRDMDVAAKKRRSNSIGGYRCSGRRFDFTTKSETVMHRSKGGCQKWAIAIYQATTDLKVASSMRLARDLGGTQKTAWFMLHRIREAIAADDLLFSGPIEADETYIGGLKKNEHPHKRMKATGGLVGKAIVAGVRNRDPGQIAVKVAPDTKAATLTGLVVDHAEAGADVFTDEAKGYLPLSRMGYGHKAVKHSTSQYLDGMAHSNGMERFWATMKRGYRGTYHQMSYEHLHRYVVEFQHRHNERPLDTIGQMGRMVRGMDHKRLAYAELIADGVHAKRNKELAA